MTISLIGAGYGRTGTLSLKSALETLGYNKCHHMIEVIRNPGEPERRRSYPARVQSEPCAVMVPTAWAVDELMEDVRANEGDQACTACAGRMAES